MTKNKTEEFLSRSIRYEELRQRVERFHSSPAIRDGDLPTVKALMLVCLDIEREKLEAMRNALGSRLIA